MTLPRVLTSVLLVPIVLIAVWYGSIPFFVFTFGICLFSIWEYCVMAEEGGYPNQWILALLGGALILLAFYIDGVPLANLRRSPTVLFTFTVWCALLFVRELIRSDKGHSLLRIITTVSSVVIGAIFLGHLLLIRDLRLVAGEGMQLSGRKLTFFLVAIIWTTDTGAWFVGRSIGRFKMAPQISPKKTWEGAVGGTILACVVGWFFREAALRGEFGRMEAVFVAFLISATAQLSDLSESLIKRSFGAKDSSQLLPGHGGILDRFDSFIFAAPFFYYLLIATGRFS